MYIHVYTLLLSCMCYIFLSLFFLQLSEQHHELESKNETLAMYERQLERTQGQLMSEIDEKDNEIFRMRREVQKIQVSLLIM